MKKAEINQVSHVRWALAHAVFFFFSPLHGRGFPFFCFPGTVGACLPCESTEAKRKCHCEAIEDGRGNLNKNLAPQFITRVICISVI
jgi:hypothetical protein